MSTSKNISMDSMLRFLDKAGVVLGSHIVGQSDQDWVQTQAKEAGLRIQNRLKALARIVRARSLRFAKSSIRSKGESVALALENFEVTACQLPYKAADVSGRWHQPIVVEVKGKRYGETKKVELGMADYELTIQIDGVGLSSYDYEHRLGLSLSFSSDVNQQDADADFLKWLNQVTPEMCSSTQGICWEMLQLRQTKIYLMCLPKITSLSAVVKKLRKFETVLNKGELYVCIADPEEAQTLQDQGFGVITFPNSTIYGFADEKAVERPADRESFGPAWAEMPVGLPGQACQV